MDVSSRFGVCEVTPCTWSLLHNRITFLWRKKKRKKKKRGKEGGVRERGEREREQARERELDAHVGRERDNKRNRF